MKITFDFSRFGYLYGLVASSVGLLFCLDKGLGSAKTYLAVLGGLLIFRLFLGAVVEGWNNGKVVK